MRRVYVVTSNDRKWEEIAAWFRPDGVQSVRQKLLITEQMESDLAVLARNKAAQAWQELRLPVLVQHAALELDHLDGLPGPLVRPWWERLRGRLAELVPAEGPRGATAASIVCFCDGRRSHAWVARQRGRLAAASCGDRAVAWGNLFIPDGEERTHGEMTLAERAATSPHAASLAQAAAALPGLLREE